MIFNKRENFLIIGLGEALNEQMRTGKWKSRGQLVKCVGCLQKFNRSGKRKNVCAKLWRNHQSSNNPNQWRHFSGTV